MNSSQAKLVAFDIETVPDPDILRAVLDKPDAGDDEVIGIAQGEALEKSEGRSDFLPLIYHKVVVISLVVRTGSGIVVKSRSPKSETEAQIVGGFFGLIDHSTPQLVSWNGSGFDLPVLALRSMRLGVVSEAFWHGPGDKWNRYTSRFHEAHTDLMDVLALHQNRAFTKLESLSLACGLPGKMGYDGSQVSDLYNDGKYDEIANYCECDALNTYLLWLRFQLISGKLPAGRYHEECALVEERLASSEVPHLKKFLELWLKHRPPLDSSG